MTVTGTLPLPATAELDAARAEWDKPYTGPPGPCPERSAQTKALAALILAAPVGTKIGPLVKNQGGWSEANGAKADAAGTPGSPAWRAALGPHEDATLTGDGGGAIRTGWCGCKGAFADADGWVRYEVWTAAGQERHGFVCAACRKLLQTG